MKKIYLFGALASTLVVIPSTATVFAQEGHHITPAILRDLEEVSNPNEGETEAAEEALVDLQSGAVEVPADEDSPDLGNGSSGEANGGLDADPGSGSGANLDDPSSEPSANADSEGDNGVVLSAGATNLESGSDEDKNKGSGTSGSSLTSPTPNTSEAASTPVTFAAEPDSKQVDDGIVVLDSEQQVQKNSTLFKTGKGTIEDPYQISTAEELDAVRYDLGAHYIQTANIDLKGINWNPIGMETEEEETQSFTGVFDGANFEITNLTIRETTAKIWDEYYGLFAENKGILKNIKLLDMDIEIDTSNINVVHPKARATGEPPAVSVGGVAGGNYGTVDHCITSGRIDVYLTQPNDFVLPYSGRIEGMPVGGRIGGIVGWSSYDFEGEFNGSIVNCENYAEIQVDYDQNVSTDVRGVSAFVGGIAGRFYTDGGLTKGQINEEPLLTNCINAGNITFASSYYSYGTIGGIAGNLVGNAENLINYGSIQINNKQTAEIGDDYVGGLFGRVSSPSQLDLNTFEYVSIDGLISKTLNFGNIDCATSTGYINGMIGKVYFSSSPKFMLKDFYNLGGTITVNLLDEDGKPIYRIANAESSDQSTLVLENCYAASDFLINGEKVTNLIGLNQKNGESLSREELIQLVKKVFPNVVIVNPGETLDAPLPTVTSATFSKDGISIEAESDQNLSGLSMVISEVSDAKNNFGLPSNYKTIGYDIHFADKKNSEVKRTGKFIVRLPIPTDFIGKTVRIFHKEDEQDEGTELKYSIIDGKFYEFETSSFSWFIVAYDKNTQAAITPSGEDQKPVQNEQKPTSIEEDKNVQTVNAVNTSETVKAETVKLEQTNVAVLEQTDSTVRRSPETSVGTRSFGSVFAGLISLLGLSVLGKKRTKNEF